MLHNDGSHRKKSVFPPYVVFMMEQRPQFGWATSGVVDTRSYGSVLMVYSIYQWFFNRDGAPLQGVWINFQRARALTRTATWKVWSINLPIDTFVCAAYLTSGVPEANDNHFKTTSTN